MFNDLPDHTKTLIVNHINKCASTRAKFLIKLRSKELVLTEYQNLALKSHVPSNLIKKFKPIVQESNILSTEITASINNKAEEIHNEAQMATFQLIIHHCTLEITAIQEIINTQYADNNLEQDLETNFQLTKPQIESFLSNFRTIIATKLSATANIHRNVATHTLPNLEHNKEKNSNPDPNPYPNPNQSEGRNPNPYHDEAMAVDFNPNPSDAFVDALFAKLSVKMDEKYQRQHSKSRSTSAHSRKSTHSTSASTSTSTNTRFKTKTRNNNNNNNGNYYTPDHRYGKNDTGRGIKHTQMYQNSRRGRSPSHRSATPVNSYPPRQRSNSPNPHQTRYQSPSRGSGRGRANRYTYGRNNRYQGRYRY